MKKLIQLFNRRKSIYSTRIFEPRTWLDQAVSDQLHKQSFDCEFTVIQTPKEQ